MKAVVFTERHLVWLATLRWQHEQIVVLAAKMGTVNNPLPIRRPVRNSATQCLFGVNPSCETLAHNIRLDGCAPNGAGTKRNIMIGNKDQLSAIGRPCWRNV